MAVPEWVNRLRVAKYISPNGIESTLKIDILSRIGGKKASIHEILNTNDAIPQDQGNKSKVYPIEAFFTGDDGDIEADNFYNSLHEQYSIDNPGILKHPRWGDITVMPFDVQQNENLVNEGGIFRVIVSFREIPDSIFPVIGQVDQFQISAEITSMESIIEDANSSINVDDLGDYASFGARIKDVVSIVNDALGEIASTVDEVEDQFRLIQDDINKALATGATALEIMSQVNNLIRLPSGILDSTIGKLDAFGSIATGILGLDTATTTTGDTGTSLSITSQTSTKVQAYATMIANLTNSFTDTFDPKADRVNEINQATIFQSVAYFSSAVISEAALFTDFKTRDTASNTLDLINETNDLVIEANSVIYQDLAETTIDKAYAPDHNTENILSEIIGNTNAILIERSFELKSKFTEILKTSSDAITLTWKYYKDIDILDFFLETNNIVDEEFLEIGIGREIVSYA